MGHGMMWARVPRRRGFRREFREVPVTISGLVLAGPSGMQLTQSLDQDAVIMGVAADGQGGLENYDAQWESQQGTTKYSSRTGVASTIFGGGGEGPFALPIPIDLPRGAQVSVTASNITGPATGRIGVTFWLIMYRPSGDENARVQEVQKARRNRAATGAKG